MALGGGAVAYERVTPVAYPLVTRAMQTRLECVRLHRFTLTFRLWYTTSRSHAGTRSQARKERKGVLAMGLSPNHEVLVIVVEKHVAKVREE